MIAASFQNKLISYRSSIYIYTYCVRRVNAALVIELGRLRPFVTSRHNFLLITSTRPPFPTTKRNNSSSEKKKKKRNQKYLSLILIAYINQEHVLP